MVWIDRGSRPDHQPQPVRHDLLHPGRPPRAARDRRGDDHAYRARPGTAPPGDNREPGRGRAGVLVLALRGRRLGGGIYGGVPAGALAVNETRVARMASEPHITSQPEGT